MSDDASQWAGILSGSTGVRSRDAERQRLAAALVEAARSLRAARARFPEPSAEMRATFERCDALLEGARRAAQRRSRIVAFDCLFQIERELVAAMDEPERRAALLAYRAEGGSARRSWRREATLELADADAVPTVATVQALMRNVHALRQSRLYRAELARRQIAPLATLLVGAVGFFVLWALAGGFEWILSEDVDVTLAMVLVNGVLFGLLGGLLSVSFSLLSTEATRLSLELRSGWGATIARVFIGAAVAIPIAFFLESGLLNLGNVTPALDIALCFLGGFSERWLVGQFERFARRPEL